MALSPGTVVAGYTIEAVLGAGGMGTVYKARNPALPRSDALKVLSEGLSRDDHFRARFLREADLAATLDHPNIVTVYTRGETEDGQLWIAMQYVDGSDAEKETRAGRMSPQRAVHIVGEVAKALDYAHRRQLLHRDVKPANFLLGSDDERVFLADFGIARALDDAANLTQTGMVVATIAYAAPESLSGLLRRRPRRHLLARLLAVQPSHPEDTVRRFRRDGGDDGRASEPAAAARHRCWCPHYRSAIDRVIARAMAKNPDDRYQSAREFAAAAAQALDETTVAVRTMPVTPPSPPARNRRGRARATGPRAYTYPSPQSRRDPVSPLGSRPIRARDPTPFRRPSHHPAAQASSAANGGCGASALRPLRSSRSSWCSSWRCPVATPPSRRQPAPRRQRRVPHGPPRLAPSTPEPTSAPPAPANVPDDALPGLLLSANDVSGRMNKPGMTAMPTEYEPLAGSVTPPNCTGAWGPAYQATYDGSGFTGLVVQGVFSDPTHKLVQAVTAFPDANAAKAFYDRQVADWNGCKNTHIKFEYQGASTEADLGVPATTAGILTMKLNPTTSATTGQQCERNMAVRANVIVDVRACSPTVGSSGLSIASAIADKIK